MFEYIKKTNNEVNIFNLNLLIIDYEKGRRRIKSYIRN